MEKSNKNIFKVLIILIVIILVIFGIRASQAPKPMGQVKIGVIIPLTGDASLYGQSVKKGIDLAVEKAAKDYGVSFEVIYEDSKLDPKLAVLALQKLISVDGVKYVIGFSSGETLAMCKIADSNKTVLISSASSPDVTTNCGDYTFRNFPSDTYQGKELAVKISEKGYKKVGVLYISNSYGVGLKDEFVKNFPGNISGIESHESSGSDFKTQLTKLKATYPDALVLISQIVEGSIVLKEKTDLDFKIPVFASETMKDPNLFKVNTESLSDLYITSISQYNVYEEIR
jgi:branched-chain amino acid transport system substrate-binding protein